MLPKADSSSFVLFSLLFVLTLTDPPRTGKCTLSCVFSFVYIPVGSVGKCGGGNRDYSCEQKAAGQAERPAGQATDSGGFLTRR